MSDIISRLPPYTARGIPPPTTLPYAARSGRTPKSSAAPPYATRNPVMTSSKIRSDPFRSHKSRNPSKKPFFGGTTPIFAAIGSTITQATAPGLAWNRFSTLCRSLYCATNVFCAYDDGTPALSGAAPVRHPEPALTSNPSECPW